MPDLLAGTVVKAEDTPRTKSARGDSSFTATITGFGVGTTSGTYEEGAVVIVAPTTGRIKIHTAARMTNSSTGGTLVAPEIRAGDVIGSGTAVQTIGDGHGVSHYGASFARCGAATFVEGLTPGASYNVRLLHRASANTATIALRELIVEPAT
ncbi:hypothetical protein GCM10010402_66050 [Actinomadura luteofluorescens]|uniref:hypothetical protein n=1 Tax=Actinomadura luteofluorescens TaxID=46163 RepID=UPI00216436AD|nr:hypothetical protein [Actinomadura glauciflava]MCR3744222.1 hypothetical protein [Actinomadura glauciflava]